MKKEMRTLTTDLGLIAGSIAVAVALVQTGALGRLIAIIGNPFAASFIAGMFFTSAFTTAPAITALGTLALTEPLFFVAGIGALGSVAGDLVIFRFIRDRFGEHLTAILSHRGSLKRIRTLFRLRTFRWFTFLAGGLVIASPLPDEFGITLLGFSKMKTNAFIPLSFLFNFLGILLIGLAARAL